MKKRKRISIISFCILIGLNALMGQVKVELKIDNQMISGTDLLFDLYLRTTAGTSGNIFLGNADFVLEFNTANFTSPTLTKEGSTPGFCTFLPTDDGEGGNDQDTREDYFNNTAVSIISGLLVINLNGPGPSDQTVFDDNVASIESTINTHRLGQFRLSGVINPAASMGLVWKTAGFGLKTKVFTLGNAPPFISTQITAANLSTDIIVLPVELIDFSARALADKSVSLSWVTATEMNTSHFEIERKTESENWTTLGKVAAESNSTIEQFYSFVDRTPDEGLNYYRLKIIDFDGYFEYSDIRSVRLNQPLEILVYPNPASDVVYINLNTELKKTNTIIRLFNVQGLLVVEKQLDSNLQNSNSISLKTLSGGVYTLQLTDRKNIYTSQIFKRN